jgi:ribosomal protein L40E
MSPEFIERWWLIAFLIFAAIFYAFGYAGHHVQQDARKRGLGKAAVTFWSVSVVFFGPLFLPLYMIFRSRAIFATGARTDSGSRRYKLCNHCGSENKLDEKICQKCHKVLDSLVSSLGEKECTHCGVMNPVDARRCRSCDQIIGYIDTDEDS